MKADAALLELADRHGILPVYRNLAGEDVTTTRETRLALLAADGLALDNDAMILDACRTERAASSARTLPHEILLESGRTLRLKAPDGARWRWRPEGTGDAEAGDWRGGAIALKDLPDGLHALDVRMGRRTETVRVIVAPPRAPMLPRGARPWGVNLTLHGLHSRRNPGPGDYRDLARAAGVLAGAGAAFAGILPVHALGWGRPGVISPYSPSDRGFLNPRHLAPEAIEPAAPATRRRIAAWRQRARRAAGPLIDYPAHLKDLDPILSALHDDFQRLATPAQRESFAQFRRDGGDALERYAGFETLSRVHGPDWRQWPARKQAATDVDVEEAGFHAWLQWHAERQLAAAQDAARNAGMRLGLYLDLAVGARRDGAEAWAERDSIAAGVSLGAPPDHLSPAGQNWDLTALSPARLAAHDYRAFRRVLRQNFARCGMIRIDHVLGLMRSFWIPDNGAPGGYIRQPLETLLALVRIEARRANTLVVGEDLGLVPDGLREALRASGLYSYSVLQYEKTRRGAFRRPAGLRRQTFACFGTHDTPTLAGYAKGRDIDQWQRLGWIDAHTATAAREERRKDCANLMALDDVDAPPAGAACDPDTLGARVYAALARSPAALVSVSLDDLLGEEHAQNLPGTVDAYPNWRRRHRSAVEYLTRNRHFRRLARLMAISRPRA